MTAGGMRRSGASALLSAALLLGCLGAAVVPAAAEERTGSPTAEPTTSPTGSARTGRKAEQDGSARTKDAEPDSTPTTPDGKDGTGDRDDKGATDGKGDEEPTKAERAEQERKKAQEAAEEAHQAELLAEATAALLEAREQLVTAEDTLDAARRQLESARDTADEARADARAAALAEDRAVRELGEVEARIVARQEDLGRLARVAYQNNGQASEWSIVLSSGTPNQLADRLAFLQSVGSAGNAVIADLAEDRADLVNARARLGAVREEAETARQAATIALASVQGKELLADAAQQQVARLVELREAALDNAKSAAVEDRRLYEQLVVQSGALGQRIVDLADGLGDRPRRTRGTGSFVLPGTGTVTSEYGPRLHPILDYVKMHTGTDLSRGDGLVYAADRGVVLIVEENVAYGTMVVVDHGRVGGQRLATLYAHLAASGVEVGDRVRKGEPIGVVGSTGYSTGPHLHFEVRVDGEPLDPTAFLRDAPRPAATL